MSDEGSQVHTDATQDALIEVNQATLNKLMAMLAAKGIAPDLRPTEWKDPAPGEVPFTDGARNHIYLVGEHLVKWSKGRYVDACCAIPEAPFNPYWGLEGHKFERIGIMQFRIKKHAEFIYDYGNNTRSIRLERIAAVIAEVTAHAQLEHE